MSKQGKVLGRSQNGIFSHGLNSYQKNIYGGELGNGIELKSELPELGAMVFGFGLLFQCYVSDIQKNI